MAFWIIEETLGLSRIEVLTTSEERPIPNLDAILSRLLAHEPLQYIFGHTLWNGLDLLVNPSTLIPRPETAEIISLVSSLSEQLTNAKRTSVLDIGTGSGCIALGIKQAHPGYDVHALDISESALATARENALRNHLDVTFHHVDILSATSSPSVFDLVVSNPPYVLESEKADMSANVLDYEPHTAIFVPDTDPLLFYRRIAELKWGKILVFEINERFGRETAQMLESLGYTSIQIHRDSYGKDRFATASL